MTVAGSLLKVTLPMQQASNVTGQMRFALSLRVFLHQTAVESSEEVRFKAGRIYAFTLAQLNAVSTNKSLFLAI